MLAQDFAPDQGLDTAIEFIRRHWAGWLWAVVLMGGGWFLGWWRARVQWRRKEFLGRLNISLNTLRDGKLLIRTV